MMETNQVANIKVANIKGGQAMLAKMNLENESLYSLVVQASDKMDGPGIKFRVDLDKGILYLGGKEIWDGSSGLLANGISIKGETVDIGGLPILSEVEFEEMKDKGIDILIKLWNNYIKSTEVFKDKTNHSNFSVIHEFTLLGTEDTFMEAHRARIAFEVWLLFWTRFFKAEWCWNGWFKKFDNGFILKKRWFVS